MVNRNIVLFINPYSYLVLRDSGMLPEIERRASVCLDGISLVFLSRLFGINTTRISFDDTSLAPVLFDEIRKDNKILGIVGSAPGVSGRAASIINFKYSNIVRCHFNGYLSSDDYEDALDKLFCCDYVVCSMGSPRQEELLFDLMDRGWGGKGFTCGGYFDQLVSADGNAYYPKIFDRFNIRWLYRLFKEPRRLWRRYLVDYPKGMFFFVSDGWIRRLFLYRMDSD